jgi:hypothetical protein
MRRSLQYAGEWVLWTLMGLFTAVFHGVWLMPVTILSLGLAETAVEALGWHLPLIVGPVVLCGVLLGNLAVAFLGFWDDRPRPSAWLVGRGEAMLVRKDEFGKLWRLQPGWDEEEPRVVEDVNRTPEPDGSYRHYFLQVPPSVRTAREAVAWTFGLASADEYALTLES